MNSLNVKKEFDGASATGLNSNPSWTPMFETIDFGLYSIPTNKDQEVQKVNFLDQSGKKLELDVRGVQGYVSSDLMLLTIRHR